MAYKPPKQQIDNNDVKNIPSSEAIYEALKYKIDQPTISGTAGQLLQLDGYTTDPDGILNEPITSWVNPPSGGANTTLSNLVAPTAINEDLIFNKATAATIQGSDAKATQANHNLTIRAGDTGTAVSGGNVTINSGTSSGGNGGSMYFNTTGGTRTASRGFFFSVHTKANKFIITDEALRFGGTVTFDASNTFDIGTTGLSANPRIIWVDTRINLKNGAAISGDEEIGSFGRAAGPMLVRGGDAVNGTTQLRAVNKAGDAVIRGGDHPGVSGSAATPAAGDLILRGGNRTAGTGNGGNVTISGGTSVGGTAGSIIINTSGSEVMRITNAGDVGIGTATPGEKLEVAGAVLATEYRVPNYRLDPHTHDEGTETTDFTINWSNGAVHTVTLNAAGPLVITMNNPVDGGAYALRIIQGATPGTVTWPANVKWPGGTPPTLSTNTGDIDVVNLLYFDDGGGNTFYYATSALAFA